jgi:molecular chaperone DnaJ
MAKDYYAVLGVSKGSDAKEIKASYRKLARKYHPDVNPNDKAAEAKFKEVSEAYEVLSNPEKRKLYDQFGSNWEHAQNFNFGRSGANGGGGGGGFDFNFDPRATGSAGGFESIFESIFQNFGGGRYDEEYGAGAASADVEKTVELTLEEIDSGTVRSLTYQTPDACKTCDGMGVIQTRGVRNLNTCPTCKGTGSVPATKKVEVKIPAGITDGKKLRVPGKGAAGSGGRSGDLYVVIKETPHPRFKRVGENLEVEVDVPFTTAALGGEVRVPTLHGSVTMKVPEGTQTGQTFRLGGKGISKLGGGGKSHLLAKAKITVPKKLSEHERRLLNELAELQVEKV